MRNNVRSFVLLCGGLIRFDGNVVVAVELMIWRWVEHVVSCSSVRSFMLSCVDSIRLCDKVEVEDELMIWHGWDMWCGSPAFVHSCCRVWIRFDSTARYR